MKQKEKQGIIHYEKLESYLSFDWFQNEEVYQESPKVVRAIFFGFQIWEYTIFNNEIKDAKL